MKVKCDVCNTGWKTNKHDVIAIAEGCKEGKCGLRSPRYWSIMDLLRKEKGIEEPTFNIEQLEFPDPIVIHVDKNGKTRTVS